MDTNNQCQAHPPNIAKFYCPTHCAWVCEFCFKNHKSCEAPVLYSTFEDFKMDHSMQDSLSVIFTKAIDSLSKLYEEVSQIEPTIDKNTETLSKFIKTTEPPINQNNKLDAAKHIIESSIIPTASLISEMEDALYPAQLHISKLCKEISTQLFDVYHLSKLCSSKELDLIKSWIGTSKAKFAKIFDTESNGFDSAEFHRKCDGIFPTLVIAKTNHNQIIGGYSIIPWDKGTFEGKFAIDKSLSCFIFSLSAKKKYKLLNEKYAIFNSARCGPVFGKDNFYIANNCNIVKHTRESGESIYENDDMVAYYGSSYYTIKHYEVYKVK